MATAHGRHGKLALALLCLAQFVDVLGVTVVVVALPSIGAALDARGEELQWVVSLYAVVFGGFLMLAARAADLYGRRRLFMAGMALFAGASLACGLSGSALMLICARAAQGLAAAIVVPAALSLLTARFPAGPERTWALGIWTAAAAAGGAGGFFLGGVLTDVIGWRAIFLANVPLGTLAVLLAPRLLTESRAGSAHKLDAAGAVTVTTGLVLVMFGLVRAEQAGFGAEGTSTALFLGLALLLAVVPVERRVTDPLVPREVLRERAMMAAVLVAFALTATTSAAAVLATLYLQDVLELSATSTGLTFLPFSLAVVAGSLLGSKLTVRLGPRLPAAAGLVMVAAGLSVALGISARGGRPELIAYLTVAGLGLGCASVAATTAGTSAVGADRQGLAAGLLNSATQIGTALGIAVVVTIAAARTAASGAAASSDALVEGFEWGFASAAAFALTAAITAATLLPGARPGIFRTR